jgi:hypothetical protein
MVWRLLLAALVATVLSVASGLFLVSCASTDAGFKGEGFGVKVEITVNAQGKKQNQFTGSLPPGYCLQVTYIGRDGKVISTVNVDVPGYSDIPDGATGQTFNFVECRDTTGSNPTSNGAALDAGTHAVAPFQWHELSYWAIDPDFTSFNPWSNTTAAVRLHLPAGVDPVQTMLDVIGAGPGAVVGSSVEVDFFSQAMPSSEGMRLIVADDEAIVDFDLTWNGVTKYATLGASNVTQYSIGNGWSVVQTTIPLSDISIGAAAWNGGTVTVRSASATAPVSVLAEYKTQTP